MKSTAPWEKPWAAELMLHYQDALRYIEDCRVLGLVILGMDFYQEKDNHIIEVNSTAWSSINHGPGALPRTINEAYRLIKDGPPDEAEWVSFVVGEQPIG